MPSITILRQCVMNVSLLTYQRPSSSHCALRVFLVMYTYRILNLPKFYLNKTTQKTDLPYTNVWWRITM